MVFLSHAQKQRLWAPIPLRTAIYEALLRKKKSLTDAELYKATKEVYGREVDFSEFMKELMKLEIEGLVHVFGEKKHRRRIELCEGEKKGRASPKWG